MSRINGEKARSAIARRNRTNRRVKDRAMLAAIREGGPAKPQSQPQPQPQAEPEPAPKKKSKAKPEAEAEA
jgi:hypothetical protein